MALRPAYPVRTARLLIRPLRHTDAEALVAYRSLPEVCRWVPFEPMDLATIAGRLDQQWTRTTLEAPGEAITIGVELSSTGELIGDLFFHWTSSEHAGGELGYMFNPRHGGRGYATEACHAMLHLAFEQLGCHRVTARVDARNTASARLALRLGMRQEAHLRENEWFKGGWSDELDFALLEREWAAQHADGCPSVGP